MEKDQQKYVEDFGLMFEQLGLGQTSGRVMGWLLICDPPHQTLDEICEALDMSKSTISTTVRAMNQFGMVERVSLRGDRRHYYEMRSDYWMRAFGQAMQEISGFRSMAERALTLVENMNAEDQQRVRDMVDLYTFLEREFPAIIERWHQERSSDAAD